MRSLLALLFLGLLAGCHSLPAGKPDPAKPESYVGTWRNSQGWALDIRPDRTFLFSAPFGMGAHGTWTPDNDGLIAQYAPSRVYEETIIAKPGRIIWSQDGKSLTMIQGDKSWSFTRSP